MCKPRVFLLLIFTKFVCAANYINQTDLNRNYDVFLPTANNSDKNYYKQSKDLLSTYDDNSNSVVDHSVCGQIHKQLQTLIHSPGYPNQYSSNTICEYTFISPFACKNEFHIQFLDFSLESSSNCDKDKLLIGDREKLCGRIIGIMKYTAMNGVLKLKFITNGSVNDKGFKILVTRLPCLDKDGQTDALESVKNQSNVLINDRQYLPPNHNNGYLPPTNNNGGGYLPIPPNTNCQPIGGQQPPDQYPTTNIIPYPNYDPNHNPQPGGYPNYNPQPGNPTYNPQPGYPNYNPQPNYPNYNPQPGYPNYNPPGAYPSYNPQPGYPIYNPQPGYPNYNPCQQYPNNPPTFTSNQYPTSQFIPNHSNNPSKEYPQYDYNPQQCFYNNPTNPSDPIKYDKTPKNTENEAQIIPGSAIPKCCRNIFSHRRFYLSNPSFPSRTTPPTDCLFVIERNNPGICRLRIDFKFFFVGNYDPRFGCANSFVEIDGRRICGCNSGLRYISQWGYGPKVIRYRNNGVPVASGGVSGVLLEVIQEECPARITDNEITDGKLGNLTSWDRSSDDVPNLHKIIDETNSTSIKTYYFYAESGSNNDTEHQNHGKMKSHNEFEEDDDKQEQPNSRIFYPGIIGGNGDRCLFNAGNWLKLTTDPLWLLRPRCN